MIFYSMSEREKRLLEIVEPPLVIAVDDRVNIEDLIHAWEQEGSIVRCKAPPNECIKIIDMHPNAVGYGCVAGWISEDD
jgi:hypothetical protein